MGSENVVNIESIERINSIGDQTDYNNGLVFPTTIDKKNQFKLKKNDTVDYCNVYSKNFEARLAINIMHSEKIKEFL
jgi:galactokinase